jgi:bifunctional DNA-binding transcriptional regulator/antitoxin component of YhaV-PrlF toxin-antitoxin module
MKVYPQMNADGRRYERQIGVPKTYNRVMAVSRTNMTTRGRTTIPALIKKKLRIGPGSVVSWESDGEKVIVRKVVRNAAKKAKTRRETPPSSA